MNNFYLLQPTNKENHQLIQTHKQMHKLQENEHITATHKIQNTVSRENTTKAEFINLHATLAIGHTKDKQDLYKIKFQKYKRYIKHNEPHSAHALNILNCKHEYGTFGDYDATETY
jgi:hypothetical protein